MIDKEIKDAYYDLYYKIHCAMNFKLLTEKQYYALFYRALAEASFEDVAYYMRFDCKMKDSVSSAKQHFYKAAEKIREKFADDYKKLMELVKNT